MTSNRHRTARNLTGSAALLILLFVYVFAASMLGEFLIDENSKILQALYFFVAGVGWIIPAGVIIKWMLRPRDQD